MSTVISVEKLSKTYRLGQIGTGTFANDLNMWWAKTRGKPNPLLKIGENDFGNRDGDDLWALRDVSFMVEQGEVLGIIGKNGAGKSTLLKILSRVTAPTSGKIKVMGRIASLLEVGTGFHPELTGRENIYLNGAILGMNRKEIARKFDEILDFSEVEKFIDTPVKRYSSGMHVRLAFAVAAHLDPEILIIDEVLAVGDAEFQKKCLGKMGEVAQEGRTVLFVSHNMGMIQSLCGRAMLLDSGSIVAQGLPEEIIPTYVTSYTIEKSLSFSAQPNPDKVFQILGVRGFHQNQMISSTFDIHEPIFIHIDYVVRKQLIGSALAVQIANTNQVICTSFDTDQYLELLVKRVSGTYSYKIVIPPKFLKPGEYTLHLNAGILNKGKIDTVENAIWFSVEALSQGDSLASFNSRRDGIVASPLKWESGEN